MEEVEEEEQEEEEAVKKYESKRWTKVKSRPEARRRSRQRKK